LNFEFPSKFSIHFGWKNLAQLAVEHFVTSFFRFTGLSGSTGGSYSITTASSPYFLISRNTLFPLALFPLSFFL
jgi:hypothetical protein